MSDFIELCYVHRRFMSAPDNLTLRLLKHPEYIREWYTTAVLYHSLNDSDSLCLVLIRKRRWYVNDLLDNSIFDRRSRNRFRKSAMQLAFIINDVSALADWEL